MQDKKDIEKRGYQEEVADYLEELYIKDFGRYAQAIALINREKDLASVNLEQLKQWLKSQDHRIAWGYDGEADLYEVYLGTYAFSNDDKSEEGIEWRNQGRVFFRYREAQEYMMKLAKFRLAETAEKEN